MVSEKPPRRSKAEKEPVTIDLPVERSEAIAEPVRSIDTDTPAAAEPADETLASQGAPEEQELTGKPVAAEPVADEPLLDEPSHQPASDAEPRPTPVEKEEALTTTARQSPSTSALLAAGIVGGLVSLALAGSMQYAGFLPAASPTSKPDTSASAVELTELREQVQALQNRPVQTDPALAEKVASLEAALSQNTQGDLPQRLSAVENQLKDVKSATQATAGNDAELTRRLEEAEAKINDKGPEQQVARAVAAAALKAAIDRGGPFETELKTLATVAGDDPAVGDLQKFASVGIPSRAQLQTEFPKVADDVLEAAAQPEDDQGIASRLISSAMSVVKVRRVGDVTGDTTEAIIARMEENLRNGDLAASAREWEHLPEGAKNVSQDFKRKLDARLQVEDLVSGSLARAVAGTQG